MDKVVIALFALIVTVVVVPVAAILIDRRKLYHGNTEEFETGKPCLTFEQFVKFYAICPKRWGTDFNRSVYFTGENGVGKTFYFKTKKDLFKYDEWRQDEERKKRDVWCARDMQFLVNQMKNEIAKFEVEAKEDYVKKVEEIVGGVQ